MRDAAAESAFANVVRSSLRWQNAANKTVCTQPVYEGAEAAGQICRTRIETKGGRPCERANEQARYVGRAPADQIRRRRRRAEANEIPPHRGIEAHAEIRPPDPGEISGQQRRRCDLGPTERDPAHAEIRERDADAAVAHQIRHDGRDRVRAEVHALVQCPAGKLADGVESDGRREREHRQAESRELHRSLDRIGRADRRGGQRDGRGQADGEGGLRLRDAGITEAQERHVRTEWRDGLAQHQYRDRDRDQAEVRWRQQPRQDHRHAQPHPDLCGKRPRHPRGSGQRLAREAGSRAFARRFGHALPDGAPLTGTSRVGLTSTSLAGGLSPAFSQSANLATPRA